MSKLELIHGKKYFSPSQLKKLYISLGSFRAYLKKKYTTTDAMNLGTAVHVRLLEPEKWDDEIVVFNDSEKINEIGGAKPRGTKAYKEWASKFFISNSGKTIITEDEFEIVKTIESNCKLSGVSDTYFSGGEAEVTKRGLVTDFDQDFEALCIIDYDTPFGSVDLKTTSKPLDKFKWDADSLGYDIQARITNALNGKEFIFVVVQTVAPYDIGVYSCSDYFMDRGKLKINTALSNYQGFDDEFSVQVMNFTL